MSAGPNSSASKQLNRILQDQQLKHQQIACINQLQQGLQRAQSLVSQSVAAYSYLLDGEPLTAMHGFHPSSAVSCTGQGAPAPDRFQLYIQRFLWTLLWRCRGRSWPMG